MQVMAEQFSKQEVLELIMKKYEHANLIVQRYLDTEKKYENYDWDQSEYEENEHGETPSTECWNNRQDAGSYAALRDYYRNPSAENLLGIKSEICFAFHPNYSKATIDFFKTLFDDEYNIMLYGVDHLNNSLEERLLFHERMLLTPDDVWHKILGEKKEYFKLAEKAPDRDGIFAVWPEETTLTYLLTICVSNSESAENNLKKVILTPSEEKIKKTVKLLLEGCLVNYIAVLGSHLVYKDKVLNNKISSAVEVYRRNIYYKIVKDDYYYNMHVFLEEINGDFKQSFETVWNDLIPDFKHVFRDDFRITSVRSLTTKSFDELEKSIHSFV